jgi:hypothetical protein
LGDPVSIPLSEWSTKVEKIDNFFRSMDKDNIVIIPTIDLFCTFEEKLCYASTQNTLYYTDATHLTLAGAKLVTNRFIEYFLSN